MKNRSPDFGDELEEIELWLEKLRPMVQNGQSDIPLKLTMYLLELQKRLQGQPEEGIELKCSHRTVQAALDIIHARYNTHLTLDTVAKEVYVATTYLSYLFKKELGVNFLDYLHRYRIEQAKQFLRRNYKVFAVARMVGYQKERRFSITFKKWTGLTPTQFQKIEKRKQASRG